MALTQASPRIAAALSLLSGAVLAVLGWFYFERTGIALMSPEQVSLMSYGIPAFVFGCALAVSGLLSLLPESTHLTALGKHSVSINLPTMLIALLCSDQFRSADFGWSMYAPQDDGQPMRYTTSLTNLALNLVQWPNAWVGAVVIGLCLWAAFRRQRGSVEVDFSWSSRCL